MKMNKETITKVQRLAEIKQLNAQAKLKTTQDQIRLIKSDLKKLSNYEQDLQLQNEDLFLIRSAGLSPGWKSWINTQRAALNARLQTLTINAEQQKSTAAYENARENVAAEITKRFLKQN